jgi:hypothetical protein
MKLKYKKIILLTTMSTMGIGLLTLSVSHDQPKAEESMSAGKTAQAIVAEDTNTEKIEEDADFSIMTAAQPTLTPTPTEIPTPTPLPVYNIEVDAYPEINQIFIDYYTAKNNRDVNTLKSLLSDPTKVESQEELQKRTEYIEEYQNIKPYTKKSAIEGTYIVYVYHEIKLISINTSAPGLSKFYVITDQDNNLKIFSGDMDEATKAYYDERSKDEDVIALMEMTNAKSEEAMTKDEDLLNFWSSLAEMAGNSSSDSQAEGDTE